MDENLNRSFTVASKLIHILIHKSLIYKDLQLKILDSGKAKYILGSILRDCDL